MNDNREDKWLACGVFVLLVILAVFSPTERSQTFLAGCATTFLGVVAALLRGQSNPASQQSTISDSKVTQVVNPEQKI